MPRPDEKILGDLVAFARAEVTSGDIEPWAATLAAMRRLGDLDDEQAAWAVKLYNAYDDFGSAFKLMTLCSSPAEWKGMRGAARYDFAGGFYCGQERRNLRGGKIVQHFNSYVEALGANSQMGWLREAVPRGADPGQAFWSLMGWMRGGVWGTGRLAAFEWAEFAGKVLGLPVEAPDGCLWESSGPRESLERIYNGGEPFGDQGQLEAAARRCAAVVNDAMRMERLPELAWVDFETVICDFNVMRKGRYYPGKHLAMIREEIGGLPDPLRALLDKAFREAVEGQWNRVPPGVNKPLAAAYRETGIVRDAFGRTWA